MCFCFIVAWLDSNKKNRPLTKFYPYFIIAFVLWINMCKGNTLNFWVLKISPKGKSSLGFCCPNAGKILIIIIKYSTTFVGLN